MGRQLPGPGPGGVRPEEVTARVVLHLERFVEYLTATYGHDRLSGGAPGRVRLAGLVDANEEQHLWRSLEGVGLGTNLGRAGAEALGFFVCDADLEDELIRALGAPAVERLLAAQGELESFRRFQDQPAQRARENHAQLRRFMGTRARRKIRYGALLTNALDLRCVPRALDAVLAHARH